MAVRVRSVGIVSFALLVACSEAAPPAPVATVTRDGGFVNSYDAQPTPSPQPLGMTTPSPTPNPTPNPNPNPTPTPTPNPTPSPTPPPTPTPSSDACYSCELARCGTQSSACDGVPQCGAMFMCGFSCADEACWMRCEQTNMAGLDTFYTLLECLDTSCATECNGGMSGSGGL